MFPRAHGGIRFAFMNATEQRPVKSILNSGSGEVRRRRDKIDSQRSFAVDAMATDSGVSIDLPSTDRIATFGCGHQLCHPDIAEAQPRHTRHQRAENHPPSTHGYPHLPVPLRLCEQCAMFSDDTLIAFALWNHDLQPLARMACRQVA